MTVLAAEENPAMSDQPQDLHPIVDAVAAARESLKGVRDVQPVFMSPAAQTEAVTSIWASPRSVETSPLRR
ncbi:hypothetical protein D0Z08_19160 [Nocardioides immobilis]|uniref:Uncharacterized protein n=1 Tax=Nocardioides immobilis TaxID=2049295 RepID=A0A417XYB8_9ACTN|nr:hypothetical protein [Nocardioides immobilis]RHW25357.1 hypothetical protein D0Z08_19160 [Nocardioides immobilis]